MLLCAGDIGPMGLKGSKGDGDTGLTGPPGPAGKNPPRLVGMLSDAIHVFTNKFIPVIYN